MGGHDRGEKPAGGLNTLSFTGLEFRATLKERQMTELEELKESTKDSVQAKQVSLYGMVSRQEPQGDVEPVYDTIPDLLPVDARRLGEPRRDPGPPLPGAAR
jgi:hypothetical protein